eukprot:gb/GEZJ01004074.1/.p2 GENE.gb/GEZJ01004074.1/~~gb/GEZJ01004074.1/.p2  ORF type:complete len:315 (+),score=32.44 gb/GEZJ01004074.1/:388-1332(+)
MISLSFGYNSTLSCVQQLKDIVEEAYARFVDLLDNNGTHSYSLKPTTHEILHLPQLLRECGPLPITYQFVVERHLGEIGRRVQKTSNLTAHVFHKNFKLLALKISNNRKTPPCERPVLALTETSLIRMTTTETMSSISEFHTSAQCFGAVDGEIRIRNFQKSAVKLFVRENFPFYSNDFVITSARCFKKFRVTKPSQKFVVESKAAHIIRSRRPRRNSRHKFCIAAEFDPVSEESFCSQSPTITAPQAQKLKHLFYASVKDIIEVTLEVGSMLVVTAFVEVKWQYGLRENEIFDLMYTVKKGSGEITMEPAVCI